MSTDQRPFAGLRVLDFTHVLAGPFATRILADMGADVVKINSSQRAVGTQDPRHPYYLMWNRNKRALALNLATDEGKEVAHALCQQADLVIDNFSAGVLDRWGIGYQAIHAVNKRAIYVQMSGMGDGGPWSKFVTYAPTIHALAGLTHTTGVAGREDIGIGFSYNDHQAGLHGAVAVLAALEQRNRTGVGHRVDISQFEVGVSFLGPALLDYFGNGNAARPVGNDLPYDTAAPHGCYPCRADSDNPNNIPGLGERWIAIACMTDQQWIALQTVMGNPQWAAAAQLEHAEGRVANKNLIEEELSAWTAQQDAYDLMQRCQSAGVPAGVVQDGADLVERDPQLAQGNFLQALDDVHPELGPTWIDKLPIHFAATPCEHYHRVRAIGEDNAEVLKDWLSMSSEQVAEKEQQGTLQ
ncbi:MAG: CaiB/BaiF CoA transferase family protein [Pseudomonadales bacterium]